MMDNRASPPAQVQCRAVMHPTWPGVCPAHGDVYLHVIDTEDRRRDRAGCAMRS